MIGPPYGVNMLTPTVHRAGIALATLSLLFACSKSQPTTSKRSSAAVVADAIIIDPNAANDGAPVVVSGLKVDLASNLLTLQGTGLGSITSVKFYDKTGTETILKPIEAGDTSFALGFMKGAALVLGTAYNMVIESSAYAEQSLPILFNIPAQSISLDKLAPANAKLGDELRFNAATGAWAPASVDSTFKYKGPWDPSKDKLGDEVVVPGDYYVVSSSGECMLPAVAKARACETGDWAIYTDSGWELLNSPFKWMAFNLSELKDVTLTSTDIQDGQVLTWNKTDQKWEARGIPTLTNSDPDQSTISNPTPDTSPVDDTRLSANVSLFGSVITNPAFIGSHVIQLSHIATDGCTNGQVMKYDGAAWVCATLSGGSTTPADGSLTGAMLANGTVGNTQIADGAINDAKISGPIDMSKIGGLGTILDGLSTGVDMNASLLDQHAQAIADLQANPVAINAGTGLVSGMIGATGTINVNEGIDAAQISAISADGYLPVRVGLRIGALGTSAPGAVYTGGLLIKAPDNMTTTATYTLPPLPIANKFLRTDANGVMAWDGEESDPKVGLLDSGKWCVSDGSKVNCNIPSPVDTGVLAENRLPSNVSLFGQQLTLTSQIADGLIHYGHLDHTGCANGQVMMYGAGGWACGTVNTTPGTGSISNGMLADSSVDNSKIATGAGIDFAKLGDGSLQTTLNDLTSGVAALNSGVTNLQTSVTGNTTSIADHATAIATLEGQITGVQTQIDGKSPIGHAHTMANITDLPVINTMASQSSSAVAITGGSISGASITATGASLTTPTITNPTITGTAITINGTMAGTLTGATLSTPTLTTPSMTNGTSTGLALTTATLTNPTISGAITLNGTMTGTLSNATLATATIATSTFTGGTVTAATVATSTITGGTIGGATITTPTITGTVTVSAVTDAKDYSYAACPSGYTALLSAAGETNKLLGCYSAASTTPVTWQAAITACAGEGGRLPTMQEHTILGVLASLQSGTLWAAEVATTSNCFSMSWSSGTAIPVASSCASNGGKQNYRCWIPRSGI